MVAIVHVHPQRLADGLPAISISMNGTIEYVMGAEFRGAVRIVQEFDAPLDCGSRIWIEAEEVIVHEHAGVESSSEESDSRRRRAERLASRH